MSDEKDTNESNDDMRGIISGRRGESIIKMPASDAVNQSDRRLMNFGKDLMGGQRTHVDASFQRPRTFATKQRTLERIIPVEESNASKWWRMVEFDENDFMELG